jgi:hypothetical protein
LLAHDVAASQIVVVENFLPDAQISASPRRPAFSADGIRRVIVVSRVDPIKRVDLLLDALDRHLQLGSLEYSVYGTGWDLDALRARSQRDHPTVRFHGYSDRIPEALCESDLLLHLCPEEPFGLAILEAMAAGLPVLLPDSGGAAGLIEPEVSGWRFRANDPDDLAAQLGRIAGLSSAVLNRVAAAADRRARPCRTHGDHLGAERTCPIRTAVMRRRIDVDDFNRPQSGGDSPNRLEACHQPLTFIATDDDYRQRTFRVHVNTPRNSSR